MQVLHAQGDDWMYLGAINFIKSVKTGAPFAECSPMLNDISGQPSWQKVRIGVLR